MMPSKVRLLGTSHIADSAARNVESAIKEFSPNFVCVELDRRRAEAVMHGITPKVPPLSMIGKLGLAGYVFSVVGAFVQRRLGHIVGTSPGVDMKAAIIAGNAAGARVVLVDRDISVTLRRFSQSFSLRERLRFLLDVVFPWRLGRKKLGIRLDAVPEDNVVAEVLGVFRRRYPGVYKALIHERNVFMVKRIEAVVKSFPGSKVLVVVGAGHVEGMRKLLGKNEAIELVF